MTNNDTTASDKARPLTTSLTVTVALTLLYGLGLRFSTQNYLLFTVLAIRDVLGRLWTIILTIEIASHYFVTCLIITSINRPMRLMFPSARWSYPQRLPNNFMLSTAITTSKWARSEHVQRSKPCLKKNAILKVLRVPIRMPIKLPAPTIASHK